MHIAIEGCSHGELDVIYNSITRLEELHEFKVDLLLCCGDFQAVRNEKDLKCMAVPLKYMQMQDFYRYYSGEKRAPVLTIFIGGNHEASNYLQELPYGGWVAPNIYYLGYAAVVQFGGLRIGGISGIYKGPDYLKGHYEQTPYSPSSIRSVYHIRNLEVFRLKQLSNDIDIFMSHDWPRGIYNYGKVEEMLRYKKHFRNEVEDNTLGSRPAEELIKKLKPDYWFSGHLHVKFSAVMKHEESNSKKPTVTKFLALDKCLPRREFLQILKIPSKDSQPYRLQYDNEWLTILRLTNHLLNTSCKTVYMPGPGAKERYDFTPTSDELEKTLFLMNGCLDVPHSFTRTADAFCQASLPDMSFVDMPIPLLNPQTICLCEKLGIDDPVVLLQKCGTQSYSSQLDSPYSSPFNKSEMNITGMHDSSLTPSNPEEVDIGDEGEFDLSKDDETGDFIMEIPLTPQSNTSQSVTSESVSQTTELEKVKRKSLCLSTPLSTSGSELLSDDEPKLISFPLTSDASALPNDDPEIELSSTAAVSGKDNEVGRGFTSPASNNGDQLGSLSTSVTSKRVNAVEECCVGDVSYKDELKSQQNAEKDKNVKKFKRRNASLYSSADDE